ncbi:hypothetical protein HMPREF9098_0690 [Kingella denitrificans ATCC 33394]|uniref:Uncharacterized protein n=1 Tax=Kingella denitrificans ATCC 33394 TaxID=888741 RepID=F0EXY0_9NEIS|nr:hypothetical protein HMPREF9098_0690 [Kingella denitrificans ATCC 33394]
MPFSLKVQVACKIKQPEKQPARANGFSGCLGGILGAAGGSLHTGKLQKGCRIWDIGVLGISV